MKGSYSSSSRTRVHFLSLIFIFIADVVYKYGASFYTTNQMRVFSQKVDTHLEGLCWKTDVLSMHLIKVNKWTHRFSEKQDKQFPHERFLIEFETIWGVKELLSERELKPI